MRVVAVRRLVLATLLIALSLTLGACSNSISSGTLPSLTTPVTETFTGSFGQGGSISQSFTVAATAPLTVSLTDVQPLTTMGLGVILGTWDGLTCAATVIAQNPHARLGATALTGTASSGNYCVKIYDSGNVPAGWTVSYTVQVVHY